MSLVTILKYQIYFLKTNSISSIPQWFSKETAKYHNLTIRMFIYLLWITNSHGETTTTYFNQMVESLPFEVDSSGAHLGPHRSYD